ncbi:hypothetical protein ABW19_dt0200385 [Dactylella cylindrospora]|nr:hypothetical protein ABW19_dt0200385 [Dactylella cylindrospora]
MVGKSLLLSLAQLACLTTASPLAAREDGVYKRAPVYCNSGGFSRLASTLSVNSATPFCSDWLSITTVTVPATETAQTYLTVTTTVDEYASTTEVVTTETFWSTITTIANTAPTTVAISIEVRTSTLTTTFTPSPSITVTSTAWYTRTAAKRDELNRRSGTIPSYLGGFAPPAISSVCSCLDIPIPSTTVAETTYNPNTINTKVTRTITNTIKATLTISSASTVRATSYVPVTSISTTTVNTITTVTAAAPTYTSVVSSAFRPQCTAILARPKLWTAIQPKRAYSYPFATTPIPNGGLNEDTFSQCCELCYNSPNCGQFYTYNSGSAGWRCQIITTYTQVSTGISAQCPLGRVTGEGVTGPAAWVPGNQARGIGPCYGYDVPI